MKAALCKSLDGPDGIVVADIAEPLAGPGEVVIAVRAAALNFFDTLITLGKYQSKPEPPFSPCGRWAVLGGKVYHVGTGTELFALTDGPNGRLLPGDRSARGPVWFSGDGRRLVVLISELEPVRSWQWILHNQRGLVLVRR